MRNLSAYLMILIVIAFPLLYYGGHSDNTLIPSLGIILLLIGMSGPVLKRLFSKK